MNLSKNPFYFLSVCLATVCFLASCEQHPMPKPKAYPKVQFPEKNYRIFDTAHCPYRFEVPTYARVRPDEEGTPESCWFNIQFPQFGSDIHLTYKAISEKENNFEDLLEDSRNLVYKHTVKAQDIEEKIIEQNDLFGIYYSIEGNTASTLQFFLSDTSRHYLRGSLYFNVKTNRDSLQPVIDFIADDIEHMISTFEWKEKNNNQK